MDTAENLLCPFLYRINFCRGDVSIAPYGVTDCNSFLFPPPEKPRH